MPTGFRRFSTPYCAGRRWRASRSRSTASWSARSDRLREWATSSWRCCSAPLRGRFPRQSGGKRRDFSSSELRVLREVGIDPRDDAEYIASQELLGFTARQASPPSGWSSLLRPPSAGPSRGRRSPRRASSGFVRVPGPARWRNFPICRPPSAFGAGRRRSSLPHRSRIRPRGVRFASCFLPTRRATVLLEGRRPARLPSRRRAVARACGRDFSCSDLALTQSRLESYILCSFAFYCQLYAGAARAAARRVRRRDRGNFTHRVLERFMRG